MTWPCSRGAQSTACCGCAQSRLASVLRSTTASEMHLASAAAAFQWRRQGCPLQTHSSAPAARGHRAHCSAVQHHLIDEACVVVQAPGQAQIKADVAQHLRSSCRVSAFGQSWWGAPREGAAGRQRDTRASAGLACGAVLSQRMLPLARQGVPPGSAAGGPAGRPGPCRPGLPVRPPAARAAPAPAARAALPASPSAPRSAVCAARPARKAGHVKTSRHDLTRPPHC